MISAQIPITLSYLNLTIVLVVSAREKGKKKYVNVHMAKSRAATAGHHFQ